MSGLITGIAGLAITAGTTAASFAQASKQKKLGEAAERKAEESMKDARAALDVNYFEDLAVQKEAYELERDATLQAEAGALQALQESGQRGVAGGVGRLALAGQKQQAATRTAMGKELSDLEKLTAQEDSRLRDLGVQLDLEEVAGAQQAAANAEEMRAAKISEGIQGIGSAAQQALGMAPLYQQNMSAQKSAISGMEFSPDEFSKFGTIGQTGGLAGSGQDFSNLDLAAVGGMTNQQYRKFKKQLTPAQSAQLYGQQFTDAYGSANINPFQLR